MHVQAHHQPLAQRVDRGIGDLGKALFEIVVEQVRPAGEHRQGDVIPHAVGGLLALASHFLDHQLQVFGGEAESGLELQQLQFAYLPLPLPGGLGKAAAVLREPGGVGVAIGGLGLDIPIAQEAMFHQVDGQHLAWPQPPLLQDLGLLQFHHPRFRTHHHEAIAGDAIAGRPQAVAVEGGSHHAAIAEHQKGWAIPGFLEAGVVLVKRADLWAGVEVGLALIGLRHKGEQAVGDGPPAAHHQLKGGIEVGRITEGRIHQGAKVASSFSPHHLEIALGSAGPVDVAEEGVDLAVVPQKAHGLGQRPARQGVGAEPAVVDGEVNAETGVAKIGIEPIQHLRAHHALVDKGAGTNRGEIEVSGAGPPDLSHLIHRPSTEAEEQGLHRIHVVRDAVGGLGCFEQPLLNHRGCLVGEGSQDGPIHRHDTPAVAAEP